MADSRIREHIEETGKAFEKFGLTPMQGRILAFLANAEKPEVTFDDLVDYFQASKSSVSTSLNHLLAEKLIDYKTYGSGRKKFFFLTGDFFLIYFRQVLLNLREMKELCYKTVSVRSAEYPDVSEKILKWIQGANVFEKSVSRVVEEIETKIQ